MGCLSVLLVSCGTMPVPQEHRLKEENRPFVGTWATSIYLTEPANMPPATLSGMTLRQVVRVSLGGAVCRVRFSNLYGDAPLEIRAAHLALSAGGDEVDLRTDVPLLFRGTTTVTIPAGDEMTSDPVRFPLSPGINVAVSLCFGTVPAALSGHPGSRTSSFLSPGDLTDAPSFGRSAQTDHWYLLQRIEVLAERNPRVVVCFGDSITDGRGSTTNLQNRWPDQLADRIQRQAPEALVSCLNQGIGGTLVSRSGVERYDRDVLAQPGATDVIVLYGVNDLLFGNVPAPVICRTYQLLIKRAHAKGLRVYGGTLLPFGRSSSATGLRELARQQVNAWIRGTSVTAGGFDGVIDFDGALRDATTPDRLDPECDSGDGLHPGPEGYRRMADAVDLGLFQ